MAFTQLDPPIPVDVVDRDPGQAFAEIDTAQSSISYGLPAWMTGERFGVSQTRDLGFKAIGQWAGGKGHRLFRR